MNGQAQAISPVTIFYSYAHADSALRNELEKHLSALRREGLIDEWYDRQIVAGTDWTQSIDEHLKTAAIILLLVSADFLASDYCYSNEMQKAMKRHQNGGARVIPIILRPVDWQTMPFAKLQALPSSGKPVTTWINRDEAFLDITKGIRKAVEDFRSSFHLQKAFKNAYPADLSIFMLEDYVRKWIKERGIIPKDPIVGFVLLEQPKLNNKNNFRYMAIRGLFDTQKEKILEHRRIKAEAIHKSIIERFGKGPIIVFDFLSMDFILE